MRRMTRNKKVKMLIKRRNVLSSKSIKSFQRGEVSLGKKQLKQSLSIGDRIIRATFKSAGHGVPASKRHRSRK